MKKWTITNICVCIMFLMLDPIFALLATWADTNSLGAEMILGIVTPIILLAFIAFGIFSVLTSLILFKKYGRRALISISVIVLTIVIYI